MSPRRGILALVVAGWLAAGLGGAYLYVQRYIDYRGFPKPATPNGVAQGTVREVRFHSSVVSHGARYLVYLPPGYAREAARGRRFPVLYLLHGVPGTFTVFTNVAQVHVAANVLIAQHRLRPMILVMPAGLQGTLHGDTEWANTRAGRWEDFILDVVRDVDHRFATRADRRDRGIVGDSEGAYGAVNIALHHLDAFSVIESWGGYFTQTPTGVFAGAPPAQLRANSPAAYVGSLAPEIHRLGLHAWLYQGRTDAADPAALRSFAARLHGAGADVRLGFFAGGHDWGLYRAKTPKMLAAAGRWFSQPPGRAGFSATGRSLSVAQLRRIQAHRHRRCLAMKPGHIPGACRRYRARHLAR
jgi:enterochelin esterase-like enzyme